MSHFITPVARSVPYDNLLNSIKADNVQGAFEELRKQTVYEPENTAIALNTTYSLTSSSNTLQFYTGTATGVSIKFPDATTLKNGHCFILANEATTSINVNDFTSVQISELIGDSIGFYYLQSNSTAAGVWVGFTVSGFATGILSYSLTSTIDFSTTSATDVLVTGFSLTPVSGRYAIWFNGVMEASSGSAITYWSIYKAGVQVTDSERNARAGANNAAFVATTQTVISVTGAQTVDLRMRRTGGTSTVKARTITLIRLGPEA